LLLFFTETTRKANFILEEQSNNIVNTIDFHHKIRDLAQDSYEGLVNLDIHRIEKISITIKYKKRRQMSQIP
jgi:galactokinase/mevalonate kinase-like predicted kinase